MFFSIILSSFLILLPQRHAYSGLFQTFQVGKFNGTIVSDGHLQFCNNPYKIDVKVVNNVLRHHRGSAPVHSISMNIAIIDIHGVRVMVDTGVYLPSEIQHQPNGGKLLTSMKMAGISPHSIDAVVLTHCHLDHSAGLVSPQNKPAFPNAKIYIPRLDHDFWSNPKNDTERQDLDELQKTSRLYLKALSMYPRRICFLDDLNHLVKGVKIRLAPGHSPGHSVVEFKHGKSRLTVLGDLWHLRELQVLHPRTGTIFDTQSYQAHISRITMMKLFSKRGDLLLSYHDHFPGLGYLRRAITDGFDWVPAGINDMQSDLVNKCS